MGSAYYPAPRTPSCSNATATGAVFWDHQLPATLFLISALRKPESLWDDKQHTAVNVTHDSIAWERHIAERLAMLWKIGLQDRVGSNFQPSKPP
jgi:hypothetical protein